MHLLGQALLPAMMLGLKFSESFMTAAKPQLAFALDQTLRRYSV
jgi:hypothetical protein